MRGVKLSKLNCMQIDTTNKKQVDEMIQDCSKINDLLENQDTSEIIQRLAKYEF